MATNSQLSTVIQTVLTYKCLGEHKHANIAKSRAALHTLSKTESGTTEVLGQQIVLVIRREGVRARVLLISHVIVLLFGFCGFLLILFHTLIIKMVWQLFSFLLFLNFFLIASLDESLLW